MNSNIMKFAFIYLAGIGTYHLFQQHTLSRKLDTMSIKTTLIETDTSEADTSSANSGVTCPCDNAARYNVSPTEDSKNIPITSVPTCSTMVANGNMAPRGGTITGKGAWFSKVTIDNMFCHKADANGIYVYKALTEAGEITFIIEAARSNKINSIDDGSSYIYYSRTMCPTMCGVCGI
jgi:hypothetical protein